MDTERLKISNRKGVQLHTSIDFPSKQKPKFFSIFAHCFTCNSSFNAIRHIIRELNQAGIAVVRFDFTGLGKSEGEFANSHFEANVQDLQSVYDYVSKHYEAPKLIIGHSLGGAAAIVAAHQMKEIKAVCTIGAPADVIHTTKHFTHQVKDFKNKKEVEVFIEGRSFTITKEFVEGFQKHQLPEIIRNLRKPILIMHAPFDKTVDIENALTIYQHAMHPKSFVSLDKADHLLSNKKDSTYAGKMIASWVTNYIETEQEEKRDPEQHQIIAILEPKEDKFTTSIYGQNHSLIADEPKELGGDDYGMSPYELVSSGLAACTTMTLKMYAERKQWDMESVEVFISHAKRRNEDGERVDVFTKDLKFTGDLTSEQIVRLKEIASKCPVHKTLAQSSIIETI